MTVAATERLIAPHGGALVDRTGDRPDDLDGLEQVALTSRELSDLDMLASGALSPLEGFMGKADYERVIEEMHLSNGVPWALPVCLAVDAAPSGERVALTDEAGHSDGRARSARGVRVRQGARGGALLPDDGRRASGRRPAVCAEAAVSRGPRDRLRALAARVPGAGARSRGDPADLRRAGLEAGRRASRRATRSTAPTST